MKKTIILLSFIMLFNSNVFASPNSKMLDNIENSLYGFTYSTMDETSRLNQIEETVYGQSKTNKPINERISALKKDMSADLIGQEITPKEDTFMEEEDHYVEDKTLAQAPSEASGVDYPTINEMEKQIFKKEFKTQNLNNRLAQLEKQALGQTYEKEDFATRVDRLQAKIKPKSFMDNSIAQSSNNYYEDDVIPLEKNYNLSQYGSSDFDYESYNTRNSAPQRVNLASVEKSLFKKSFNEESTDNRISRLESTMFGTTFSNDTEQERLNRISSAYKAQKSANKYDSNRFTQNMGTAMQIGTILLMILACVL